MLPPTLLLIDSNYLRSPDLRGFLKASPGNAIAIDHLVLFEIFKKNPGLTSKESLVVAAEFVEQIYVIKPTHRWLHAVITSDRDLEGLIDPEATKALRDLCKGLFISPLPDEISAQLVARQAEATDYIDRLSEEMREYDGALREKAENFSSSQLAEIRTGNGVSDETREKISGLLHEITGHFILSYQEPNRTEPLATVTARNMFAFRYALCVVLFYLEWVRLGRSTKKLNKRLNDIIDLQIATVSTFFSGVASNDAMTLTIAREATAILANWGAFIRFVDHDEV
ncbi:hypothetical protein E0H35_32215 [Rhizobium leguminosarum bv. viciae]|uniref:hypothetical protein n=1 Tax=Rhizobium TaxID=379 RepID=UPI0010313AB7|nr:MULTISPECIES: hypothetical protein [Rhizobium]MBY5344946.1 hypothetical protein [Rhizobium leguminosarum]MBY5481262.1 hypothetical protein [Rhizobium leguminosarum]MBY5847882.1 hypothetical protein [Rhizobium leguminosarum]TAW70097.1 hypothetical protein ELI11_36455 [Rhizobium ruizarguesonis]TAY27337.1 hypothetical protein ELH87_38400 [Rhizobium ruizarguesonis]